MTPKPRGKRLVDKAWEHCVRVVPNDDHQVKCKYCPTTMYGGINRLKHHLARVLCKMSLFVMVVLKKSKLK
jgi:hypothetical protein